MPEFTQLPLLVNAALFVVAGLAVWFAGARVTRYADAISEKTGLGQALLGLLLLAGVTSLPEIGVTVSAAAVGNADLAANNLFGSIAMQVAVLAVVDFAVGRRALTSSVPEPAVLLLCALNVLLLTVPLSAIVVGDVALLGIGLWAWGGLAGYLASLWLLSQTEGRRPWLAAKNGRISEVGEHRSGGDEGSLSHSTLGTILVRTIAAAAIILVAGFLLARTGEAIAQQTGLGSSFVGYVLVAISTSLPEFSTALAAARLGLFTMALSDILGTNLINVGLIFLVDAVDAGDPVLNRLDGFSVFGIVLAIAVTALFLIGLVERRDRTFLRMGIDSVAVLAVYVGGLILLFNMR